jgi:hypothetical protein
MAVKTDEQSTSTCNICGPDLEKSFSGFESEEDNPTRECLEWIRDTRPIVPMRLKTIVVGHYAGR